MPSKTSKARKTVAKGAKNPVVKKWIAALRSGEYEQGKSTLVRDDKYCCLGVLTDLALKQGIISKFKGIGSDGTHISDKYDACVLHPTVKKWAGLTSIAGAYGYCHFLTKDNDDGKSFGQIANIIESEPEGLFVS